jgi:GT2 family glycosyltransferase
MAPLETQHNVIASFGLQRLISNLGQPIPEADAFNADFWRTPDRAGKVDCFLAGATGMFPNNGFIVRSEQAKQVGYDDGGRAGYARDFYFGFRLGRIGRPFFFVPEFTAMCRLTEKSESRNNPNSDNPFRAMSILLAELSPEELLIPEIKMTLRRLAPLAITVAARRGARRKALEWLFSPYYRHAIYSPKWWWRLCQCFLNKSLTAVRLTEFSV